MVADYESRCGQIYMAHSRPMVHMFVHELMCDGETTYERFALHAHTGSGGLRRCVNLCLHVTYALDRVIEGHAGYADRARRRYLSEASIARNRHT